MQKTLADSFGIDATEGVLRVVGLSHNTVVFSESFSSTIPESLSKAFASGSHCWVAAPPSACLLLPITPPELPPQKVQRILPALLELQLPFPFSECQSCWVPYPPRFLAHTIRRSDLSQHLSTLQEKGINPAHVLPPAHAAWTLAATEFPQKSPTEPRAVIVCGNQQSVLLTGQGAFCEKQSIFKSDATEIMRRLRLNFAGLPKGLSIILAGSSAPALQEPLAQQLGDSASIQVAQNPAYFLARACASAVCHGSLSRPVDFRTGSFAHPASQRKQTRPTLWLTACLALCSLLLFGLSYHLHTSSARATHQLESRVRNTIDYLAGYHVKVRGERAIQEAREGLQSQLDPTWVEFQENSVLKKLASLNASLQKQAIQLHHFTLDSNSLSASGIAPSTAALEAWMNDLTTTLGYPVVLSHTPKNQPDGSVSFNLHTPQQ